MIFLILILLILGSLGYMFKLNHDLLVNKDNILRSMAALDAMIIKKNLALLDIVSFCQDTMTKDSTLIKDILALRHEVTEIKPKIVNAPARYQKQAELDKKIKLFLNAFDKYPELGKNAGFQSNLQKFVEIEQDFQEKVDFYNICVDKLNKSIHSFPSSIIAEMAQTKEPPPKYDK